MDSLSELWNRIRSSSWYLELPEWLREPPGLYVAAGGVVVGLGLLAWRLFLSRWAFARAAERQRRAALRGELRARRKSGDHRAVGQALEALGKSKAALHAYRRGGNFADAATLLRRLERTEQAKEEARRGGVWDLYAELCEADGEQDEAALGYERSMQPYAAARCYQRAGRKLDAARCYLAADMETNALTLLAGAEGRDAAELLEKAIRAAPGNGPMTPEAAAALRHCSQLWLIEAEPERAWRLAVDREAWEVAVPIARDHLPPSLEAAEACSRAGAHLVAAEIYQQLGERRMEALLRAEHFQRQENATEAARWFETAEEWGSAADHWAAAGEAERGAELYAKAGDYRSAAELYGQLGNPAKQKEMLARMEPMTLDDDDPTEVLVRRKPRPTRPVGIAAASDRYVLREEIGRGGMGVVYRAEDQVLRRAVAYKFLPRELGRSGIKEQDLLTEARNAARLSHPNIVQVYDAGRSEDGYFIVMELVEGETFDKLLESRKLSLRGAIQVARQVCAALAHAHERNIVHRDLKPSNLMWAPDNRVKLADFGLARVFEASIGAVVTRPAGTPFYVAPEQIRGDPVGPQADLYSLGCVLFELVCNRGPFAGGSSIYHHLNTRPDDPREIRERLPEELSALILQCLAKEPAQRPRSAAEVGKALVALAIPG